MRLNIGMLRAEEFLRAIAGKILYHIDILAAAIVTLARITLSIFIRQMRAHRRKHSVADKILRGDQLNMFTLASQFILHRRAKLGIHRLDRLKINHDRHRLISYSCPL